MSVVSVGPYKFAYTQWIVIFVLPWATPIIIKKIADLDVKDEKFYKKIETYKNKMESNTKISEEYRKKYIDTCDKILAMNKKEDDNVKEESFLEFISKQ